MPSQYFKTDRELYLAAVVKWGAQSQLDMLGEECAELIAALNKVKRGRIDRLALMEEIADVEIMVEQARTIFGDSTINDIKREKLRRLEKRINA